MSEGEIETQRLPCKLSPSEREAKTAELVRLEQDESKQKAAKKAATAGMNADLKTVRAAIDQLVKELDEGTEVREVPVKAVYDYEAKRVTYVRTDTDQEIDSREMDSFDLEQKLPFDDLPPPAKPQKRTRKKKHGELNDLPDSV